MKRFQAKDVQRLIGIPKHRYGYISSKIGIKPEIEEVEKTGYTHLYSFKNLLEFSFVHIANNLGLGPKAVKEMLDFMSNNIYLHDAELFNPEKTIKAFLHYADIKDSKYFLLSGDSIPEQGKKGAYLGKGFDTFRTFQEKMATGKGFHLPGSIEAIKNIATLASIKLDDIDGYITINLGVIKDRILKKLNG